MKPAILPSIALCALSLILQLIPASGQAPVNDAFVNATNLGSLPVSAAGTVVNATAEPGELNHASFIAGNVASNSVWWRYTAPIDQTLRLATSNVTFDHVIGVYTESLGALDVVTAADAAVAGPEEVIWFAAAGTTYYIVIDGFNGDAGLFTIGLEQEPPPGNDNFANATDLGSILPATATGTNLAATAEAGEPNHTGSFSGNVASTSIWYRWQATSASEVFFSAFGNGVDVLVSVYTGNSLAALTPVAEAEALFGSERETASLTTVAGTVYHIAIDSWSSAGNATPTGDIFFEVTAAPANDDFANATDLGAVVSVAALPGSTIGASAELLEPDHGNFSGGNVASGSVWYRWQSVLEGRVLIEAGRLDSDVALAVYRGSSVAGLTEVVAVDRGATFAVERVYFDVLEDEVYYIAVDAYKSVDANDSNRYGNFALTIQLSQPNDAFADAIDLADTTEVSVNGSTVGATGEFQYGEPDHAVVIGGNLSTNSVWYRWTASGAGDVNVAITNAPFDSVLAIYTGSVLSALTPIVSSDFGFEGGDETVSFTAAANQEYYIAIDAWSGNGAVQSSGVFNLQINSSFSAGPYETWIAGFPTLSGADTERLANPAKDGIPNLLKLLLGLDPTISANTDPNRANLPLVIDYEGGKALRYRIAPANLGAGAQAITHSGQTSNDLSNWLLHINDPIDAETWVIPIPEEGGNQVRLLVTDPAG